jgi:UDP-N-acetylglucosamine:LPS N-acetylglucosamine transferase
MIKDENLSAHLLPTIRALILDRPRRESMRQAVLGLAKPDAAHSIAHMLHDLAKDYSQRGN